MAFVNSAPITRAVLAVLNPGATVIRYGIGYDNIDTDAAKKLGIQVANVPDYGVATVANHASASVLTLLRRIPMYDALIKSSGWAKPGDVVSIPGFEDTVIGLVGFGRIAQAVRDRLAPFGFTFVAYDPFCDAAIFHAKGVEEVTLEELARRSHAVTLHVPNSPETSHLVDAEFLARMRPGAVLINTARAPGEHGRPRRSD